MNRVYAWAAAAAIAIIPAMPAFAQKAESVSGTSLSALGVGEYRSDEPLRYRQAVRRSVYVRARDGTKLAVDIYLPAVEGRAVRARFPVVFEYTRYARARPLPGGGTKMARYSMADAAGVMQIADKPLWSELMLAYGYALVVADMRGAGASFGPSHAEGDDIEGKDGADLINWIAKQPWSDGTVGMLGASYLAEVQPRVAAERPPALKALSMVYAFFDGPSSAYGMGGIFRSGWQSGWVSRVAAADNRTSAPDAPITNIPPVDGDQDQRELRQAVAEHRNGVDDEYFNHIDRFKSVGIVRDELPFLDTYQKAGQNNLYTLLPKVNASGIPTLLNGGWHDIYANDMLYWFANLTVPRKMIYGPYPHGITGPSPNDPRDTERDHIVSRETLRWFDHWLRKIPNGADTRAPVHYGVARGPARTEWFSADDWPTKLTRDAVFHLSSATAGSARSQNDGSLAWSADGKTSQQGWVVDPETSLGNRGTRWAGPVYEIDVTNNDLKSMTFTSPPLARDLYVAGIPSVRLFLSSADTPVIDVHAYLTAVAPDGTSRLVSEGILRSSHRTLGKPPYRNFGLPFPSSLRRDVLSAAPLSVRPEPMEFGMIAVGRIFQRGERLRLTIAGADRDNVSAPEISATQNAGLHMGGETDAWIRLPIVGEIDRSPFE